MKTTLTRYISFLFLMPLLIFSSEASAQTTIKMDTYLDQMYSNSQNKIDAILNDFKLHLEPSYPELYDSNKTIAKIDTDLKFDAKTNINIQQIRIPLYFFIELDFLLNGWVDFIVDNDFEKFSKSNNPDEFLVNVFRKRLNSIDELKKIDDYAEYLFNNWHANSKNADFNILTYPEWANRKINVNFENEKFKREIKEDLLNRTVAFVMAHEIAHIIYQHKNYSDIKAQSSRIQEYEADKFALDLFDKMKYKKNESVEEQLGLTLQTLAFRYMRIEEYYKTKKLNLMPNTHPRAACRIIRLWPNDLFSEITSSPKMKEAIAALLPKNISWETVLKMVKSGEKECTEQDEVGVTVMPIFNCTELAYRIQWGMSKLRGQNKPVDLPFANQCTHRIYSENFTNDQQNFEYSCIWKFPPEFKEKALSEINRLGTSPKACFTDRFAKIDNQFYISYTFQMESMYTKNHSSRFSFFMTKNEEYPTIRLSITGELK